MLGRRGLQAASTRRKLMGSAGRVISCLLDRLYTLPPRLALSFRPSEFSARGTTIILQSRRASTITSPRRLLFQTAVISEGTNELIKRSSMHILMSCHFLLTRRLAPLN